MTSHGLPYVPLCPDLFLQVSKLGSPNDESPSGTLPLNTTGSKAWPLALPGQKLDLKAAIASGGN